MAEDMDLDDFFFGYEDWDAVEDDGFPKQCLWCKQDCAHAGVEGYSYDDDECSARSYSDKD